MKLSQKDTLKEKTSTEEKHSNLFFLRKKIGVSLIALVITIIVIIILAAIVMFASNGTVEKANYAKFTHEFSEIQGSVDAQRAKNGVRGNEEEDINYGFTKVYVDNAPESFVSFNQDAITGYWVDLEYVKMEDVKTGKEELVEDKVTFGKEDVYIYDAEGKLYYAKGYPDNNGDIHYRIDEVASSNGRIVPSILLVEYILSEDKTSATVTVVAEALNGGNLIVTGGGKTANQVGDNAYQLTTDKNGTIMITVREEGGGSTTRSITIEGIQKKVDITPPIISSLTSAISGNNVIIQGIANDNEGKIIGYAFTSVETEPETWNRIASNSITPTYTTSTSGTYYFWVKNESDLIEHASITVTAPIIKKQYTISYHANGGSNAPNAQTKIEGESLTLSGNIPTRTGYIFKGWSEDAGATTSNYQPGGIFIQERNATLYAVWEKIPEKYTITYDANGGNNTPSAQTKTEGQPLILSSLIPTKDGYNFLGWSESKDATMATYQAGGNYTSDRNTTLYAVWEIIPNKYTITYHANGGSNEPSAQTKTEGEALILSSSTPSRIGYSFLGWAETSGATTAVYLPGGTFEKDGNITLYAIWLVNTYTIQYDGNGGDGAPSSQTKTYNQSIYLSSIKPEKPGYKFKGWATSQSSTTVKYQPGSLYATNADVTLYAVWEIASYTITYNINLGTPSTAPGTQMKGYNTSIVISDQKPNRRRYSFKGWATSEEKANNGLVEVLPGDTYSENSDLALYAVWESKIIPSIANVPKLGTGMEAVYWNDENATTEFTASSHTSAMYSYTVGDGINDTKDSKWANAKTEDGSYWVWIPRYAYKLVYYTNSLRNIESATKTKYGDVDILFLYGTSNTQYRDKNGNPQPLPDGYIVHPAFQKMTTAEDLATNPLGKWNSELEGIWVAKYEASREDSTDGVIWTPTTEANGGNNTLTTNAGNTSAKKIRVVVKPSVTSWRNISESTIFTNCKEMYPVFNSHEMKNSEWGAIAYLTYSPYGRNGNELAVNQCTSYYTGAGKGRGSATNYNSTYAYSKETVKDENDNITAYGFEENYAWNTDLGKLASTTGNIYGIYDMSGGAFEYVASYVMNGSSNLSLWGNSLINSSALHKRQVYTSTASDGSNTQSADYALCENRVYGDAVYEISFSNNNPNGSWCDDYSYFPSGGNPFFGRGGYCIDTSRAGVFEFFSYGYSGNTSNNYGFRPVLCVESAT